MYVEPPLDETNLMVVDKLFGVLLYSVCWNFIETLGINVYQGYWPEVFFVVVVVSLSAFWYQDDADFIE